MSPPATIRNTTKRCTASVEPAVRPSPPSPVLTPAVTAGLFHSLHITPSGYGDGGDGKRTFLERAAEKSGTAQRKFSFFNFKNSIFGSFFEKRTRSFFETNVFIPSNERVRSPRTRRSPSPRRAEFGTSVAPVGKKNRRSPSFPIRMNPEEKPRQNKNRAESNGRRTFSRRKVAGF